MSRRSFRPVLWVGGVAILVGVGWGARQFLFVDRAEVPAGGAATALPIMTELLDEAERAYLWEVEHHGQLLSQRGFPRFTEALRRADADALLRLLASDFRGGFPRQPAVVETRGHVAGRRIEDAGHPPEELTAGAFVARLLEYRHAFNPEPRVQLSLVTLSPPSRSSFDGEWRCSVVLRLWGTWSAEAPAETTIWMELRHPRPADSTFAQSGWIHAARITQVLETSSPRWLLREVAAERGIQVARLHDNWNNKGQQPSTGGAYLTDYDRDGYVDLLVTDLNGTQLYKGGPDGRFTPVISPVNDVLITRDYPVAAFVDLDGDGWDDLILARRIFHNQPDPSGGRRFVNVTYRSNLSIPPRASQVTVVDYDRDGRLDLYITFPGTPKVGSWVTGKSGDDRGNILLRNRGDWQFEDVTEASGVRGGNRSCFTAVWFDANDDGWPDVHVINEFGDGVLLVNQGNGTFREHRLSTEPMDFGSMGATCGDIDNDGHLDLYVANMYSKAGTRVLGNLRADAYPPEVMAKMRRFVTGSQLWRNRGGLQFEAKGEAWRVHAVGWAYGPALVDLDNDGFLDIYATAGFISQDRSEPDG